MKLSILCIVFSAPRSLMALTSQGCLSILCIVFRDEILGMIEGLSEDEKSFNSLYCVLGLEIELDGVRYRITFNSLYCVLKGIFGADNQVAGVAFNSLYCVRQNVASVNLAHLDPTFNSLYCVHAPRV